MSTRNITRNRKRLLILLGLIICILVGFLILFFNISPVIEITLKKNNNSDSISYVHGPVQPVKKATSAPPSDYVISRERQQLEKYLTVEAALLGVSNDISLYYKNLNNSADVSLDPSKSWIPASTIKSFVTLEAFRQRRVGTLNFDQVITISSDNVVPTELETEDYPRLRDGTKATVRQLIEAMIVQSDNTAYNALLDILDRRNINQTLRSIGITETVVGEKLNLDDSQFQKDLKIPGRQPNTTTVKDLASLFEMLYKNQFPDSLEILDIFKKQKINSMIPALLPSDITVAHKTGDWAPIYHDGGIIYKPDRPFILAIFTNSNDPKVLAKIARVAYYQNSDVIGEVLPDITSPKPVNPPFKSIYYLADQDQTAKVLGVSDTSGKFPDITNADLGITLDDLQPEYKQANIVNRSLITPGSILYGLKRLYENFKFKIAQINNQETNAYIEQSQNRLSEVLTLADKNDISGIKQLLDESSDNLSHAADSTKNNPSNVGLISTTKMDNTQYAVLAQAIQKIGKAQKDQFIDTVYDFYKKNQIQVEQKVQHVKAVDSLSQKPIIGTITKINNNLVTLSFDDRSSRVVNLISSTPIREFNQTNYQPTSSLTVGSKVAVVGESDKNGDIISKFILDKIPQNLPSQHKGVIIEIDPNQSTLKIKDQFGLESIVHVNNNTLIRSKDTSVSLDGIIVGSEVQVFGSVSKIESSPSALIGEQSSYPKVSILPTSPADKKDQNLTPTSVSTLNHGSSPVSGSQPTGISSSSTIKDSKNKINNNSSQTSSPPASIPVKSLQEVNATTVTIIHNSSGTLEKNSPKESKNTKDSNKPAPKPPTKPQSAPANLPPENNITPSAKSDKNSKK